MNLKLSLAIRKSLIDYGYDVEMTRITDVYVELNEDEIEALKVQDSYEDKARVRSNKGC